MHSDSESPEVATRWVRTLQLIPDDTTLIECSDCDVASSSDIATISSASERESEAPEPWVNNVVFLYQNHII